MVEAIEATENETGESWLDEHADLSAEDRTTLSKYKTRDEALKGSANAIRQVGKSIRWPDDKTSDEDRVSFDDKVHEYQGVPKTKEDYKLERGEIPDELYDNELEDNFRQWCKDHNVSQAKAAGMHKAWSTLMISRHQAIEDVAKKAEEDYRKELGNDADIVLGKPGDLKNIGKVKETLIQLSKLLKLDYTDDKLKDKEGNLIPQSHLLDCLELNGKNGAYGDKVPLAKMIYWMHENFFAEGKTFAGEPLTDTPGGGEAEAFTDDWYKNPEPGGAE